MQRSNSLISILLFFVLAACSPSTASVLEQAEENRSVQAEYDGWDIGLRFDLPPDLQLETVQLNNDPAAVLISNRPWGKLDWSGESTPQAGDILINLTIFPLTEEDIQWLTETTLLEELKSWHLNPPLYGYSELIAPAEIVGEAAGYEIGPYQMEMLTLVEETRDYGQIQSIHMQGLLAGNKLLSLSAYAPLYENETDPTQEMISAVEMILDSSEPLSYADWQVLEPANQWATFLYPEGWDAQTEKNSFEDFLFEVRNPADEAVLIELFSFHAPPGTALEAFVEPGWEPVEPLRVLPLTLETQARIGLYRQGERYLLVGETSVTQNVSGLVTVEVRADQIEAMAPIHEKMLRTLRSVVTYRFQPSDIE